MKKLLFLSFSIVLSAFMLTSCNHSSNTDNQSDNKIIPQGYVDLGLPSGTLWKAVNESGGDGYYTYNEAVSQFGGQLPTKEQWEELKDYCEWTWREPQGGYKVTGPNGKFIVLPAAGLRTCGGDVYGVGSIGYYWSSTPDGSDNAWFLNFTSSSVDMNYNYRCSGFSVRLVQNK